ncbi:MAG: hypothetical protein R2788_02775 [Saprospiraceae bacterium]
MLTPKAGGALPNYLKKRLQSNHIEQYLWSERFGSVLGNQIWSGQRHRRWKEEAIKNAEHPNIRFFTVQHRTATVPQIDLASEGWEICSPETMTLFQRSGLF